MFKVTPNPPDIEPVPHDFPPRKPSTIFFIDPKVDNETLLAHACESLASASVMASDLAARMEGTHRNTLLGIQQNIMLGELAVNRVLDNLDPPG
ncbi:MULTISPECIES: DUF6124 family protein [Pseudomonas]|uniref:DUF3077 domain-containing protein n=1 Tax=Pseudomonas fluorescens TaxID=294 RepID=A0A5E7Q4V6_PSEFL|nr:MULTISPECIES: DUF6124 family protein [Pseudomonas]MDF9883907.1 hypothetical protein [Pseudomonas silensiensis]PMV87572.1 hypothetical protein C1X56_10960 [Pseudomonas sp. GW101-1A09]PMV90555.1 hypothetical protein C1X55_32625 [Pseudomonas sp. GW460-C8]PMV94259.1 hypothetical protein C1X51_12745 [Pseudomonas sp. FW306-2-2C-B10A]PMW05856.1 hypothetical protein C1X50_11405 [Pseudomonas sp. MPR-TSA4]